MMLSKAALTLRSEPHDEATDAELRSIADADVAVLDLCELKGIDAQLLGRLVLLKKSMLRKGKLGVVRLVVRSSLARRMIHVAGLAKMFEIYSDRNVALRGVRRPGVTKESACRLSADDGFMPLRT